MIFEERRIHIKPGSLPAFLGVSREETWPGLVEHGGSMLALLGGMIGDPMNQLLQVSRFPSFEAWESAQQAYGPSRAEYVETEAARALRQISGRPKATLPEADRRPVYGVRKFMVRAEDVEDFAHRSENDVWVQFEAVEVRILGMWTTVGRTEPQEVLLATGYTSVAHWEATRGRIERPASFADAEAWNRAGELASGRNRLVVASSVALMRSIEFGS